MANYMHSFLFFEKIRDKYNTRYQFIQDAVDMIIPLAGLGYLKADEGIVGLAG